MSIAVGTKVRVKDTEDVWLRFLVGKTATVAAPEDEGQGFDWRVRFDFDPQGELTSFYESELEVIA